MVVSAESQQQRHQRTTDQHHQLRVAKVFLLRHRNVRLLTTAALSVAARNIDDALVRALDQTLRFRAVLLCLQRLSTPQVHLALLQRQLRQHVHRGHVQEGARTEQHGQSRAIARVQLRPLLVAQQEERDQGENGGGQCEQQQVPANLSP